MTGLLVDQVGTVATRATVGNVVMPPSSIRGLLATAQRLEAEDPAAAFLIGWAAWEAYVHRVASVALQFQGLSTAQADGLLSDQEFWRQDQRNSMLARLLGQSPASMKTYGRVWRDLYDAPQQHHGPPRTGRDTRGSRSFYRRRHRLIHGAGTVKPTILRDGVRRICVAIDMPLFAELYVPVVAGDAKGTSQLLGDPLTRYAGSAGSRRGSATVQDVSTAMGLR